MKTPSNTENKLGEALKERHTKKILWRRWHGSLSFDFCFKALPSLEWIISQPLVAAVLIAPKGSESPGGVRTEVICALVFFSI